MRIRLAIWALAALLLTACGDDSTAPSPTLDVEASLIDATVDHGWLTIDGANAKRHLMTVMGDSLLAAGVEVSSGLHDVDVVAVDDNESSLFAGTIATRVPDGAGTVPVQVELVAARPDLRLSSLTHVPDAPVAGDSVIFIAEVTNSGPGFSGPTRLQLRIGAETTGRFFDVPAMQVGEILGFERKEPLAHARLYQVVAFVDPQNEILELIDVNNAALELVTVVEPSRAESR